MTAASLPEGLPPLAPDGAPRPAEVVEARLANGVTVWVAPRAGVPLAAVRVVAAGGRAADPSSQPGLADLLAASLKEGTRGHSSPQLAALFQGAGAELAAAASPDAVVLQAQGLAEKWRTLVDGLSDVVVAPGFPLEGVERVKALAAEELATNESEPGFLSRRAFAREVYGSHPYAVVSPTRETIAALSPHELHVDARRYLRPERTLVVVAGDVEPDKAVARLERRLGDWKAAGAAPSPARTAEAPEGFRRIVLVDRPGSVQAVISVGGVGVARAEADAHALALAITVYGGAFASRLVDNLRSEKGYAYSPHASSSWLPARGTVRTTVAVRNEVAGAALNELFYELDRMGSTDASEEELSRARRRDAGAHALRLETLRGLAAELSDLWLHGLPPAALGAYVEALPRLGAAQVRSASRRYLASSRAVVVAVGDAAAIRAELAPFGPLAEARSL